MTREVSPEMKNLAWALFGRASTELRLRGGGADASLLAACDEATRAIHEIFRDAVLIVERSK